MQINDYYYVQFVVLRQLVEYYRIPLDGSTIEYRKAIRIIEKEIFILFFRIFGSIFRLLNGQLGG